jgi:hypothetical protein
MAGPPHETRCSAVSAGLGEPLPATPSRTPGCSASSISAPGLAPWTGTRIRPWPPSSPGPGRPGGARCSSAAPGGGRPGHGARGPGRRPLGVQPSRRAPVRADRAGPAHRLPLRPARRGHRRRRAEGRRAGRGRDRALPRPHRVGAGRAGRGAADPRGRGPAGRGRPDDRACASRLRRGRGRGGSRRRPGVRADSRRWLVRVAPSPDAPRPLSCGAGLARVAPLVATGVRALA